MDFGSLLQTAQKNDQQKIQPARCYKTKFEPPKKEQKSRQLSENIKKFLARQEDEEKQKRDEANKRKERLLALRAQDKKATRRVSVMLKRTKSANKSCLNDNDSDDNSTTVTAQPDEDDYGYVSQEASAFYNKMMEKYNKMPQEPKFSTSRNKSVSLNLNNTRERIKTALNNEVQPKKHTISNRDDTDGKHNQVKSKNKPKAPPIINFADLLKIAEKKQYEPILIEAKPQEEEKLLTGKQKKELEILKQIRERKEKQSKETNNPHSNLNLSNSNPVANKKTTIKPSSNTVKQTEPNKNRTPNIANKVNSSLTKKPLDNKQPNVSKKEPIVKPKKSVVPSASSETNDQKLRFMKPLILGLEKKVSKSNSMTKSYEKNSTLTNKAQVPVPHTAKRRVIEDDDEYESDLSDFIDDGPLENEEEEYSKHIREIFGYDKSKYRHCEDDDLQMESSFAQQMREEVISTKFGIMEDLEDMRQEEEHKKKKMKRLKHR